MTKNQSTSRQRPALAGLGLLALIAGLAVLPGCRGDRTDKPPRQFFPDMDDQPKIDPQTQTPFFEDGRSDRPLVARTVPFGSTAHDPSLIEGADWAGSIRADRDRLLREDETFAFGLMSGSTPEQPIYADFMPVQVSRELIIRGRERFDIYCSACHGYTGKGDGTVGVLWSYPPSNLLADLYRDRSTNQGKDGYLFHITRNGLKNPDGTYRMPGYGHAVDEQDAWAIVAYIRALQASQGVPLNELDPADRARLTQTGGNP